MSEVWSKWESQVINGGFPLRRLLGASDHSAVFLTEHKGRGLVDAAIKLVPAHPAHSDAQLSRWKTATTLSHEHLLPAFESGRCQLGGHPFLYLVMEYAEENLAQVLPHRPLTGEEVLAMLEPLLQGLAYLHGRGLAQGQVKPSNILVVGDQVKLATDTIRPIGQFPPAQSKWTAYDPPEARSGTVSSAGDVWALGITVVEALTQSRPAWPEASDSVSLPLTLPSKFVDMIRRCLNRSPSARPTVAGLEARVRLRPPDSAPEAVQPTAAPSQATVGQARPTSISSSEPTPGAAAASKGAAAPPPMAAATKPTAPSTPSSTAAPTPPRGATAASATTPSPTSTAATSREQASSTPRSTTTPMPASPRQSTPASASTVSMGATPSAGVGASAGVARPVSPDSASRRSAEGIGSGVIQGSSVPAPGSRAPAGPSPASRTPAPPAASSTRERAREPAKDSSPRSGGHAEARPSYVPQILAILIIFAIVWGLLRYFTRTPTSGTTSAQSSSQIAATPPSPASGSGLDSSATATDSTSSPTIAQHEAPRGSAQPAAVSGSPGVLHQELPSISGSARSTIRGRIKISVRVTTDQAGNVIADALENAGPSKYFARQVATAARKWKFAPIPGQDSQQWVLWFELTREGTTARAIPPS